MKNISSKNQQKTKLEELWKQSLKQKPAREWKSREQPASHLCLSPAVITIKLNCSCQNISLFVVMDVVRIELTLSMLSVIFLCSSITSLSLSFLSASRPPSCNISSPTHFFCKTTADRPGCNAEPISLWHRSLVHVSHVNTPVSLVFFMLFQGHPFLFQNTARIAKTVPCHSLFKGHKVIANNVVLNCQQCNQCLKCQVSGHKIFKKT